MLLLIDIGNTKIKWAITDTLTSLALPPVWLHNGSISHEEVMELGGVISTFSIRRIIYCNVAGDTIQTQLLQLLIQYFPGTKAERFSSSVSCAGIKNTYQKPSQLGADRFASSIAAHALYPNQALIVATCGTATTIDAVSADGTFIGGMITPGLQVMAQSLATNTAQLPQVKEQTQLQGIFATNTEQAIVSGCVHAQVGAMCMAFNALENLQVQSPILLISGGAAPYIVPYLPQKLMIKSKTIHNLVLTGLLVVAKSIDRIDNDIEK